MDTEGRRDVIKENENETEYRNYKERKTGRVGKRKRETV